MTTNTITLATIEESARRTADTRNELVAEIEVLKAGIDSLKRQASPRLRAALAAYNTAEDALRQQVESAPGLFQKPRTVVFHGLKIGYQKGKGGLSIEDEPRCVQLIRKHLPEQADVLIRVTEKPARDAIAQLPASDLKRIGVHIVDADDQVVLKPVDGDIEKLIKTLTGDELLNEESGS